MKEENESNKKNINNEENGIPNDNLENLAKNTVDDIMNFAINEVREKKEENNLDEIAKNTVDDILQQMKLKKQTKMIKII